MSGLSSKFPSLPNAIFSTHPRPCPQSRQEESAVATICQKMSPHLLPNESRIYQHDYTAHTFVSAHDCIMHDCNFEGALYKWREYCLACAGSPIMQAYLLYRGL